MRAVVHTEYGGPDVLRILDVERPVPADDEVLVEVHATTVNRTDCGFRAGAPWAVIDRTYRLEEAADATRYVETEQKTGNVVLIV